MNTEAILGSGGTGKSTLLRERIAADPQYALLTSSTGISAVNLGDGVTTIHSALGFYDLRSLREAAQYGKIKRKALELAERGKKNVVLDEVSMFSAEHFQLVHNGFAEAAWIREDAGKESCGLIVVGDACQLAPIPDSPKEPIKYFFEASCWEHYEANLTRLTKIYRQDNPAFLSALQLARRGRGVDAALELKKAGVEFAPFEDENFDGITLFPVNAQVDSYNCRRLAQLPGPVVEIPSQRWGKERGEWKNIPQTLELKDGALVMVLVNQGGNFEYVNGDLATFRVSSVTNYVHDMEDADGGLIQETTTQYTVETKRGYIGAIPRVTRRNVQYGGETAGCDYEQDYLDSSWGQQLENIDRSEKKWTAIYLDYMAQHAMKGEPYWEPREKGVVTGEIQYMPLRLAYASSYHKIQGLTLDKVQISFNHYWAGNPGMAYVALSRVRAPGGLRIIGDVNMLSKKIRTDQRVMRWV